MWGRSSGSALRLRTGQEALVRRESGLPAYDQQVGVGGRCGSTPAAARTEDLRTHQCSLETDESPREPLCPTHRPKTGNSYTAWPFGASQLHQV